MKISCSSANPPPIGGLMAVELYRTLFKNVEIKWGTDSSITLPNSNEILPFETSNDLIRILENEFNKSIDLLQKITMNHWLSFSLIFEEDAPKSIEYLDKTLGPLTFLVGESLTVSDLAVFGAIYASPTLKQYLDTCKAHNILRWKTLVEAQAPVAKVLGDLPSEVMENSVKDGLRKCKTTESDRLQEGKFIELPHAVMGEVVVRFPPEASGYLHIGHAKAALLNQYYQKIYNGKLIMRFDDTNPAKENVEFEKVILEDLEMLEIKPDMFTHTSEYFDLMMEFCEKLLSEGKAYVDDTPAEQMKTEREQKIESKNRNNSVEKNLNLWDEMKRGTEVGLKCCVRAKIDMQSTNGCLRDPTMYRCKPEVHPRTGCLYRVYPTYDFACPIVDSVEGVTHVLRTMEYHDRDPQFYWFIEALGLRKPYIWEYSRLSMTNTVLSKRKLTWFVEERHVDGWDDPRMPTVRGVLRRGMTVEALRQFIHAQGSSRSVVFMEWDKIWAINKKVIDPIAPRYTALEANPVPVNLANVVSETNMSVALHPKNPEVGCKTVLTAPRLLIDQADAKALKEGENTTFINYGNVMINKVHRASDGTVTSVDATPNLENKDYKKTLKVTWLADSPNAPTVETYCVYFDHIISKPVLGKDEDFKKYIGHKTRWEVPMLGEPELSKVRVGDIIQLQRIGFFRVDVAPSDPSPYTMCSKPLVLFQIPDGSAKELRGQEKRPAPAENKKIAKEATPKNVKEATPKVAKETTPEIAKEATPKAASAEELNNQIIAQGNLVRSLKTAKAEKPKVDEAVFALLELKASFKAATGQAWKPGIVVETVPSRPSDDCLALIQKITKQADFVRSLKAAKAEKPKIDEAVKELIELKGLYKVNTGEDWRYPPISAQAYLDNPEKYKEVEPTELVKILKGVQADLGETGKILRDLNNACKKHIDKHPELAELTAGIESRAEIIEASVQSREKTVVATQISEQEDLIRKLKAERSPKPFIRAQIETLHDLRNQYRQLTGEDWVLSDPNEFELLPEEKEESAMDAVPKPVTLPEDQAKAAKLSKEVAKQEQHVNGLKASKAAKELIDEQDKILQELKKEYNKVSGKLSQKPKEKKEKLKESKKEQKKDSKPKEQNPKSAKEESASGVKKVTRLGLEARKEDDLPEWYSQVITKSEMIDYYDISGCYILRPWAYSIWETIRNFLSPEFKKLGVKDGYFPIFVSKAALEREKTHIADFAPEVAWVTHSGTSELAEHIAIRPTSETVMYPAYARWIQSHRDLPYKLNQWNNVVRWEFKQPQPFLRTREFLWQEGHTAFRTDTEATEEVSLILDLYARVYEDLLAIPVIKGHKTEKEKFAGAAYTTTVEAYVPASGRAIQGATSHHLGQNFSKMFEIAYDDAETLEKKYVYQNSWGITTRTIGVMVLVHGDNKGLVLPPQVAEIQAVVVPCGITVSSTAEQRKNLIDSCKELVEMLVAGGVRAEGDYRDNYSPGWKFNHWELKGVPVRVEIGPKDMAKGEVVAVQRFAGEKMVFKRESIVEEMIALLKRTHTQMFDKATKERDARLSYVTKWKDFLARLEEKHLIYAPFCGEIPCEESIKNDSARNDDDVNAEVKGPSMGAKSLCIPLMQPHQLSDEDRCIYPYCLSKPKCITLFGRSY